MLSITPLLILDATKLIFDKLDMIVLISAASPATAVMLPLIPAAVVTSELMAANVFTLLTSIDATLFTANVAEDAEAAAEATEAALLTSDA
jgi:hypothetical protein